MADNYCGFVYKWHDQKRDMFYIGSHNGSETDSYICSNKRMLTAYKKRPIDFSRKILEYNTSTDISLTLQLEQKFLDEVADIKDDPAYYNKKNEAEGGWSFITDDHISKRAGTLKEKHKLNGLSESEKKSYKTKIDSRLARIKKNGFTEKETNQHNSYGYRCKVILPDGEVKEYMSLAKASKDLNIDCFYAKVVTAQGRTYKGHKVFVTSDPEVDCRSFKN